MMAGYWTLDETLDGRPNRTLNGTLTAGAYHPGALYMDMFKYRRSL